jgi:DNA-binding SARP family transcriptional activator/TolB-like protein/tetratricopeptide (TPR) repeat protein
MDIRLRTLGGLDLRGSQSSGLRALHIQQKRIALLVFLAIAKPRGYQRRDTLLGLLWPDQDTDHARAALRQALHALRHDLGEDVLLTRGEEIALNGARFRCDVWEYEAAVSAGQLDRAATLYGGDLLPGFFVSGAPEFEQWLELQRARLARSYESVLERLAETAARSQPAGALAWWRELAERDPLNPRIALRLMAALEAAGDVAGAIRHAEHHAALMRDELAAVPDANVVALADRLRNGVRNTQPEPMIPAVTPGPSVSMHPAARRRVPAGFTVLLVLFATSLATAWRVLSRDPDPIGIMVRPFTSLSADRAGASIAAGLTDGIRADLGTIAGVRVVSRSASEATRGSENALAITHLLEGRVRVAANQLLIDVRLVERRSGAALLSRTYRGITTNVFAIDGAIARDVAGAFGIALSPDVEARLARTVTSSAPAYEHYLRGRTWLNEWNRAELDSAIVALETAVALDSGFALARATLANAYLEKADLFDPRGEWRRKAFVATEMALHAEPDLAEAHLARGNLLWTAANGFPHEAALREFRHAVRLRPSLAAAHDRLALIYFHVGLLDEALAEAREAARLDPLDLWARFRVAHILTMQQRYDEATTLLQNLPEDLIPMLRGTALAEARLYAGDAREALDVLNGLTARYPDDPLIRATRALAFAWLGDSRHAQLEAKVAASLAPGLAHGHHAEFVIGLTHARLGHDAAAIAWLQRAARDGFPCYPRYANDPLLKPLRKHASFLALLRELNETRLKHEREARLHARTPTS